MEVYQSDFNAERLSRENIVAEKEKLAEELRHMQSRYQHMVDELETYQRRQFDEITTDHG